MHDELHDHIDSHIQEYDLLCRIYERYLVLMKFFEEAPIDPRDWRDKDEDDNILLRLKSIVEI